MWLVDRGTARQSFLGGSILCNLTLKNEQIWLVKNIFHLLCTLIVLCSPDRKVTLKGHYVNPWGSKNVSNILIMTVSTQTRISSWLIWSFFLKNFLGIPYLLCQCFTFLSKEHSKLHVKSWPGHELSWLWCSGGQRLGCWSFKQFNYEIRKFKIYLMNSFHSNTSFLHSWSKFLLIWNLDWWPVINFS